MKSLKLEDRHELTISIRKLECEYRPHGMAPVEVVADMHHTPTGRATAITDVALPEGEIRILGPSIWHPASLHAARGRPRAARKVSGRQAWI
jgi:hypothetical protein